MTAQKKHSKHPPIARLKSGKFHTHEWGIMGTVCTEIDQMADKLMGALYARNLQSLYLDESHNEKGAGVKFNSKLTVEDGFKLNSSKAINTFDIHRISKAFDMVLVNSNHFKAAQYILVFDERKFESLGRKLDRLPDVKVAMVNNDLSDFPDSIQNHLPEDVVVLKKDDLDGLVNYLNQHLQKSIAPLNGLILSGGKSQRMGEDKSEINYHGIPQGLFEAQLLENNCQDVFISLNEQSGKVNDKYEVIKDVFLGLGPLGGILSAFQFNPNAAWLTLACDLPYLNQEVLTLLVESRDTTKYATCFHNPETDFPEPLITIWEPRAYPQMLEFLSRGYACPRKVLINSDIKMIKHSDNLFMKNVNHPEEKEEAKTYLSNQSK